MPSQSFVRVSHQSTHTHRVSPNLLWKLKKVKSRRYEYEGCLYRSKCGFVSLIFDHYATEWHDLDQSLIFIIRGSDIGSDISESQFTAEKIGLDYMDVEGLKKLNKNKKLVKKLAKKVSCFPCLRSWKFPALVTHQESLESKVNETKAMVKFQLKKVLCMGVAVGNLSMEEKQIFQNVQLSVNFLVSLLKKNWQNVSEVLVPEDYHGEADPHLLSILICNFAL
ncbi:hypothetical protein Scep_003315 [Stephania cephalantha]|uniref:Ribosomal protein L1 n=1 Tax=Stephania cephalantha TaxID=152367 RepID=A0AAP0KQ99_9MAGN